MAKSPRIAVGNGLIEAIAMDLGRPEKNLIHHYRKSMANQCKEWIIVDKDNIPILDYAGPQTKKIFPRLKVAVDLAIDFVEAELKRFNKEKNIKLEERYFKLRGYLLNRKQNVWK